MGLLCSMNSSIFPSEAERRLIDENRNADVRQLVLRLRASDDVRPAFVAQQISGRQIAARKIPSWVDVDGIVFPQHLSMEQCSSELTARYKAELVDGDELVDLTGGFGVDFAFMAKRFHKATHVEMNADLSAIAAHNMPLLGLPEAKVVCSDGVQYLESLVGKARVSTVFLDPARRDRNGRKTVLLSDCQPDVTRLVDKLLAVADSVLLKLSPMLDISDAIQRTKAYAESLHVVAVAGECKELVLLLKNEPKPLTITAVNLLSDSRQTFTFSPSEEENARVEFAAEPLAYLYEPNAAVLKSGAFRAVAERCGVMKIQQNSHLYTSERLVPDFPGRIFKVEGFEQMSKSLGKTLLSGVGAANISTRNFPISADEIRKRLKLKDGGNVYLLATTLLDGRKVIIRCSKENARHSTE